MYVSHLARFSLILAIFQVLQCVILILHVFQCLPPYFMSYHVSFSFSSFVSFLAIFQVLQCVCIILHVFQFSCHNRGPLVYISLFHVFQCFSQYSRSYNISVSFSNFFSFLATMVVPQCVFLIFHVFHFFSPYYRS